MVAGAGEVAAAVRAMVEAETGVVTAAAEMEVALEVAETATAALAPKMAVEGVEEGGGGGGGEGGGGDGGGGGGGEGSGGLGGGGEGGGGGGGGGADGGGGDGGGGGGG